MNLHFEKYGESGDFLIILHGLFGSADNWSSLGKQLGRTHQVYLIDQRNHGKSQHSDEWNYQVMAEDIFAFFGQEGIINPIVIGHSMGGKTAMKMATLFPDLLQKLIVVDIAPKYYPVHHRTIIDGLQAVAQETIASRKAADEILQQFIPELPVRQFLLKNLVRGEEGNYSWRMNLPVIYNKIENVGEELPGAASAELSTLFVRGSNSDYILDEDKQLLRKHFSNSTLSTIEGAGHWVHAEKPKDFLELITEFVSK